MARLPTLWNATNGTQDNNNWGAILNAFLEVAHNTDGTLKSPVSVGSQNDVLLERESAAVLSLRNGTTAQTFRVYGTTTGSRYIELTHNGSVALLNVSGTDDIRISEDWDITGSGTRAFRPAPGLDNALDIGSSSLRVRHLYLGGQLLVGASQYVNFGTTTGETGYGLRDNGGTMQFKNSGGAWTNL